MTSVGEVSTSHNFSELEDRMSNLEKWVGILHENYTKKMTYLVDVVRVLDQRYSSLMANMHTHMSEILTKSNADKVQQEKESERNMVALKDMILMLQTQVNAQAGVQASSLGTLAATSLRISTQAPAPAPMQPTVLPAIVPMYQHVGGYPQQQQMVSTASSEQLSQIQEQEQQSRRRVTTEYTEFVSSMNTRKLLLMTTYEDIKKMVSTEKKDRENLLKTQTDEFEKLRRQKDLEAKFLEDDDDDSTPKPHRYGAAKPAFDSSDDEDDASTVEEDKEASRAPPKKKTLFESSDDESKASTASRKADKQIGKGKEDLKARSKSKFDSDSESGDHEATEHEENVDDGSTPSPSNAKVPALQIGVSKREHENTNDDQGAADDNGSDAASEDFSPRRLKTNPSSITPSSAPKPPVDESDDGSEAGSEDFDPRKLAQNKEATKKPIHIDGDSEDGEASGNDDFDPRAKPVSGDSDGSEAASEDFTKLQKKKLSDSQNSSPKAKSRFDSDDESTPED